MGGKKQTADNRKYIKNCRTCDKVVTVLLVLSLLGLKNGLIVLFFNHT